MKGPTIAEVMVALADQTFDLVHDQGGGGWALDGTNALKIGSEAFTDRLAHALYLTTGKAAPQASLTQATGLLRAMARWDGPEVAVGLRVAGHDGLVVVDLADAEGQVVVIGPDGWTVTTESPVPFHRPLGMLALPVPERGGSLDDLEEVWPLADGDLVLVLGWLLGCFDPSGAKPVLDLSGTQGSGKSLLAKMLRSLVDPNADPLQAMPTDVRNLAVIAARHAVLALDNVSVIPDELSDALCRLATPGAGFEVRKLYTDDEVVSFGATRPVLLTGIPELARQGDLVDRTISIVLPEIGPGDRRTEAEIMAAFDALRPQLLGVVFVAVVCAIANLSTTVLPELPRMADFATWVEAGAPAFGWERGLFLDAYVANRREASAAVVEGSFIAQYIPELADQGFTGTATECLARLAIVAGPDATRHRAWPSSPKGLAGLLRRLAPSFAESSVIVEFTSPTGLDRRRIIRIHRADDGEAGDGAVLPFARQATTAGAAMVEDVVDVLRNLGVDATWSPTKAGGLAMLKAGGRTAIAVLALNRLGVPGPNGRAWTEDVLRGVV